MSTVLPQTIEELALLLEVSVPKLEELSQKAPFLYSYREIPRPGKQPRIIEPPHRILKEIQRKLLKSMLTDLHCDSSIFAQKGKNIVDAVLPHVANPIPKPLVLTMDIKNFFPTVTTTQVYKALTSRGISQSAAQIITRLTTHNGYLPQGAPTSVALARLVIHPVIKDVKRALNSLNVKYFISVYVDDITISGPVGLERMVKTIVNIFKRHGFELDTDKKLKKMLYKRDCQEVLGIRIDRGIEPTKKILQRLADAKGKKSPAVVKGIYAYIAYLEKMNKSLKANTSS